MEFIINALLAGVGVSIIAGPLGSIMIWKKMVYFGETLAHATLLGVCISLSFNINPYFGLIFICSLVAISLNFFSKQKNIANDAILGILAHTLLSFGLIVASKVSSVNLNLLSYLQGDILSISKVDLALVYLVAFLGIGLIKHYWNSLISGIVHEDLAFVDGINVNLINNIVILLMALVFAVAMQLIGVLLLTSLFIIPASTARQISNSPEKMVIFTSLFGIVAVCLGIYFSVQYDVPTGPAIVVSSSALFLIINLSKKRIL